MLKEAILRRLASALRPWLLETPTVFGPDRVRLAPTAVVHNALFNTVSGPIVVEDWAFFGHDVRLLTGTHEIQLLDQARQTTAPGDGHGIIVRRGAWVASGATILGPCTIGEHAVVAAGAVVTGDVPAFAVVAGVPARQVRTITPA